jgi:hypothetical protein
MPHADINVTALLYRLAWCGVGCCAAARACAWRQNLRFILSAAVVLHLKFDFEFSILAGWFHLASCIHND